MLAEGRARCDKCTLVAIPVEPGRHTGMGRAAALIGGAFAVVVVVEAALAVLLSNDPSHFLGLLLFITGLVGFLGGGFIAASESLPLRTVGGVSLQVERRRKEEAFGLFGPIMLVVGSGLLLILLGWLLGGL